MTDISAAITSLEHSFQDIGKHAANLAVGLQNAAPIDKSNTPNNSVQYLFDVAEYLNESSRKASQLFDLVGGEQVDQLKALTHDVMQRDKDLREKYQIGEKFRFIKDHLAVVFADVEEALNAAVKNQVDNTPVILEDEVIVYVYLFNAHGINLESWQKMVIPAVLYEYSVNRPIYTEKKSIDALIIRKPNVSQHAYLSIIVSKSDIITVDESYVCKVREGSLRFNKVMSFTHNKHDYIVSADGSLIKKD